MNPQEGIERLAEAEPFAIQAPEVVEGYLSLKSRKAPRTQETYRQALGAFISWTLAEGIASPNRDDLQRYAAHVEAGHKASTSRLYLTVLKNFYKYLATHNLIMTNPAADLELTRHEGEHTKEALTPAQVARVFASLPEGMGEAALRDRAIVVLLFYTGLRLIELQRADVRDLHREESEAVLYIQGKGRREKKEKAIIPELPLSLLSAYLESRDAQPEEPLFVSCSNRNRGQRMTTHTLSQITGAALKAAGINDPRYTAHSTRHTAATLALLNGATLQEAQMLMRHASIDTTSIYLHNLDRIRNAPERKIAGLLDTLIDKNIYVE